MQYACGLEEKNEYKVNIKKHNNGTITNNDCCSNICGYVYL